MTNDMKTITLYFFLLSFIFGQSVFAAEPRISLTASDGAGLELRKLEVRAVLDGFLAFTELEMVFYNPQNRRREGRFQIVLPDNAAISRFAMQIGERLQEGEVVEKQLARRAYEDFLHRRQDPALLEIDSGNRFNARVFPIEPKAEKRLILSYSQRLDRYQSEYVLPLKGLPLLQHLSIKVFYDVSGTSDKMQTGELSGTISKRDILRIDKRNYRPAEDFRLPYQQAADTKNNQVMRSGRLTAARIVPFADTDTKNSGQNFDALVVLADTSASQAPFLADTAKRLEELLPQLNAASLLFYTFDQDFLTAGKTDSRSIAKKLAKKDGLGASCFDKAFAELNKLKGLKKARLLLVSDAVATAGETSASALAAQLKKIPWLERVDVLIPSYHNDRQTADILARAGQTPGVAMPLALGDARLVRKLTSRVYADIPIEIPASAWYWPERIDNLQAGEALIVFAELPENEPLSIRIAGGKKALPLAVRFVEPVLLKREWVRARLDKLLALEDKTRDRDIKRAYHNEIINLSVKQRVLSPYTALLVLETENDYRRFNIGRRGLADILSIGADGITVLKRTKTAIPPRERAEPRVKRSSRRSSRRSKSRNGDNEENGQDAFSGDVIEETAEAPPPPAAMRPGSRTENRRRNISRGTRIASGDSENTGDVTEPDVTILSEMSLDGLMSSSEDAAEDEDDAEYADAEAEEEEEPVTVRARIARPAEAEPRLARRSRQKKRLPSWTGRYAEFRALLDKGAIKAAGNFARQWRKQNQADVMALIALGEWHEKTGDIVQAARAYGSLIDYFPARADIRRWAAERLLSIKTAAWLSVDSLEKAVAQRPGHPSGHYLLALAYWEAGQYKKAVETLQAAEKRAFNSGRFQEAKRILSETLALMFSALEERKQIKALFGERPPVWDEVEKRQLRFVLMWETDANDVDFHIYDNRNRHAYYSQKNLASGGVLYADITTGYGPECFAIPEPKAFPYTLQAHYYSMGPMGYGMGVVHLLDFSPKQGIRSAFRPFVVMQNSAFVELGKVK
ncbi:MAG: tetratricopeptide repeat protein [Gammaproteobacteria bacterium]|nr:tetratricopeptide repeat protein [Gammaproteobacteria bacterium]